MARPRGEADTSEEISFGDRVTTIRVEVDVDISGDASTGEDLPAGHAADGEGSCDDDDGDGDVERDDAWLDEVTSDVVWKAEGVDDDEPLRIAGVRRAPRASWLFAGVVAAAVLGVGALLPWRSAGVLHTSPAGTAVVLDAALAEEDHAEDAEDALPIAAPGHAHDLLHGGAHPPNHPFPKTRFARGPKADDDTLPRLRPDYGF